MFCSFMSFLVENNINFIEELFFMILIWVFLCGLVNKNCRDLFYVGLFLCVYVLDKEFFFIVII